MCTGMSLRRPPHGIPIPEDVHAQYPDNVKAAWDKFNVWWEAIPRVNGKIARSSMPAEVKEAMELILVTPIPTYEERGYTGADSCYMIGVHRQLGD